MMVTVLCAWERDVLDTYDQVVRLKSITPGTHLRDRGPIYAHLADEGSMAHHYRVIDRGTLVACELRRGRESGS